jgi:hypothetical protein
MNLQKRVKLASWAGIMGPLLLGGVVTILTITERDFMASIGWKLNAPLDWPSGLALGPSGWIMTSTFLISGILIIIFASGLRLSLPPVRTALIATWLLTAAGFGMIGLVSPTDKTIRTTPATLHGRLHDASFVVIGLTLMPAMILLGFAYYKNGQKGLAIYTWVTTALAIPTFWLKGFAFYIFLFAILTWCEVVALRLWSIFKLSPLNPTS